MGPKYPVAGSPAEAWNALRALRVREPKYELSCPGEPVPVVAMVKPSALRYLWRKYTEGPEKPRARLPPEERTTATVVLACDERAEEEVGTIADETKEGTATAETLEPPKLENPPDEPEDDPDELPPPPPPPPPPPEEAAGVEKVTSGPYVVPALLVEYAATWYGVFAVREAEAVNAPVENDPFSVVVAP
jgi:hypothetical protein